MSEMRKLMEAVEKLDEGYFSRLATELNELYRANPNTPDENLIAFVGRKYGDEAADYFRSQIDSGEYEQSLGEDEVKGVNDKYDRDTLNCKHCGDYYCTSKFGGECPGIQRDLFDESAQELFVNDEQHEQITAALAKRDPELTIGGYGPGKDGTINVLASTRDFDITDPHDSGDRHLIFDPAYGDFIDSDGFNNWVEQNPFESIKEAEEAWREEETFDEMVEYWKGSLSRSIVSKGVFTQMYDAAGQDIDVLNREIEEEAYLIAETYYGSDEGIGTSDQNHFIASIARSLGIDDVFGWRKPQLASDEDMERDKANRAAKYGKAVRAAEPHPSDPNWPIPEDLEEDEDNSDLEGDDWLTDDEYRMIKSLMAERGHEPHSLGIWKGNLVAKDDLADGSPEYTFSDDGEVINIEYDPWYNPNEKEMAADFNDRNLKNPFESLEERIVKVPRGLRGEDPQNQLGLSREDAEQFVNSLGPDDTVSTEVVDPETGELLDWPDRGTRRELGQKQYKRDELERSERDAKDHEEGYDSPYLYVPGLDTDPERAWEGIETLKYDREFTDFYNIVWRSVREYAGEPEDLGADTDDWADLDYDVDIDIPVAIKRKDGKKFNKQDRQNFDMISKIFKAATGNIGVHYIGSSDKGTVARFNPTFM